MKKSFFLLQLLVFLMVGLGAFAQTVTGVVMSEDGPLPGATIIIKGTTRMGDDPKNSVVDSFERLHDVDNVFVVDGGPFVSQADKNPTWTILALSWRTSDFIVDQFKQQNF